MKILISALALSLSLIAGAHAAAGGEGNNSNCNGKGNINSPCQPRDVVNQVPEPGSLLLVLAGLVAIVAT